MGGKDHHQKRYVVTWRNLLAKGIRLGTKFSNLSDQIVLRTYKKQNKPLF